MTDEELLARMEALLDRLKAAGAAGDRDSILITGRALLELALREGGGKNQRDIGAGVRLEDLLKATIAGIDQQIGKLQ
jgi:hypothetical protein